ncbi:MAG: hypothetical protein ACTFAL_04595 [Candidatus Electronema sp. V4]|uniref:hypothetical protein n=1 Tax=Candidatus Electronema sp. V4 TaxID=3454756 RepID=UPI0040556592
MKLINDLSRFEIKDYKKCIEFIVDNLSSFNFIESILQFGSVDFPGISDIDLMIIVNDLTGYEEEKKRIKKIIDQSPHSSYFFHHDVIVIYYSDIRYIGLFHSVEKLNCLYGRSIAINDIEYKFGYNQVLLWNIFFYRIYFHLLNTNKPFSQRKFLLIINNLATSIKYNDLTLKTNFYRKYKEAVNQLRRDSINNIDENFDIISNKLLREGVSILKKQEKNISSKASPFVKILFFSKRKYVFFSNLLEQKYFLGQTILVYPIRYWISMENMQLIVKSFNKNGIDYHEMKKRFISIYERY